MGQVLVGNEARSLRDRVCGSRRDPATLRLCLGVLVCLCLTAAGRAENWPRWRGPRGNAVSAESGLPTRWDNSHNVVWRAEIQGEGTSSPIVWEQRVFLTAALEDGLRRLVHCLDRQTGQLRWTREVADDNPELASSLTGYAAPTPVTDGQHVVVFFGNAGLVCFDLEGNLQWHRPLGIFESELGLASSPVLHDGAVIQVCDHDGNRFRSFDSFLVAVELQTGAVRWRTTRPKLFRSWSTPVVVETGGGQAELVVNAQDELRGYDPQDGRLLWQVQGMTGWVTPSPVFAHGLIFATSGRDGPTMAVRPGGRGDVTDHNVVWQVKRGSPYVCSPLVYGEHLYVHSEQGVLNCYEAVTGRRVHQSRLPGKFMASAVAADGKVFLTNEEGTTYVVEAKPPFRVVAENQLNEPCLASLAVSQRCLFIRTSRHLYCVAD